MVALLSNPSDGTWGEAETTLKSRLGNSYGLFCENVVAMNQTVLRVRDKLALDPKGKACTMIHPAHIRMLTSSQPQLSDPVNFKQEYKRLKFIINKFEYGEDLADLRNHNKI